MEMWKKTWYGDVGKDTEWRLKENDRFKTKVWNGDSEKKVELRIKNLVEV